MRRQIGRLWQIGQGWIASTSAMTSPRHADQASADEPGDSALVPTPDSAAIAPPEQPVLLLPSGDRRPVHVGEVLPARRTSWPRGLVRLPAVPKRAILAAGLCAGLAAPTLAKHLVTRVLLGRPSVRTGPILEITRIVYSGPLNAGAASAIEKALAGGRR
jgi:hypothetical protein